MHFSQTIFGNDAKLENAFSQEQVGEMQILDHNFDLVAIWSESLMVPC